MSRKPAESAVTPKMMRLNRAKLRASKREEEEDEGPGKNSNADNPYMMVNHMFEKKGEKCNFAHKYENTCRREICTALC